MIDVSFFVDPRQKPLNSNRLAQALREVPGVTAVHIDPAIFRATISYQPQKADTLALVTAAHDAGYSVITKSVTLFIAGMTCAGCAFHIESALTDLPGVIHAEVDLQTGATTVTLAAEGVGLNTLCQAVQETGYQVREPVPGR